MSQGKPIFLSPLRSIIFINGGQYKKSSSKIQNKDIPVVYFSVKKEDLIYLNDDEIFARRSF